MKKLLLVAALGCLGFGASAQSAQLDKTSRINLSFGLASPMGDFKDTKWDNDDAGYANTGAFLSGSYSKNLNKNFAVGATIGWRNNPFNIDEFVEEAELDDVPGLRITAESWRSTYVLGDVYGLLPVTSEIAVYGKGSVGAAFSRYPGLTLEYEGEKGGTTSAKSPSLAYGLAIGARFDLGRITLGIESGILANKPEFEMETEDGVEKTKQAMNISTSLISVGFRF